MTTWDKEVENAPRFIATKTAYFNGSWAVCVKTDTPIAPGITIGKTISYTPFEKCESEVEAQQRATKLNAA